MLLRFLRRMVSKVVARSVRRQLRAFEDATHYPREWQERILLGIVRRQCDTAFGRDHRFDAIHTPQDFRRNVPVRG